MEKHFAHNIYAFLALLALFACTPTEIGRVEEDKLYAVFPDSNSDSWKIGDKVAVYSSAVRKEYSIVGKRNSGTAILSRQEGSADDGSRAFSRIYAIYPYSSDYGCRKDGSFSITVPYSQSFSAGAVPRTMMAASIPSGDSQTFNFEAVLGILNVHIEGSDLVKKLVLRGAMDEVVGGAATLTFDAEGRPVIEMSAVGSKQIVLDCGEGVSLAGDKAVNDFKFVLPPITFNKGVRLDVYTASGENPIEMSISDSLSVTAGQMDTIGLEPVTPGTGTSFLSFKILLSDGKSCDAVDVAGPSIVICVPRGTELSSVKPVFAHNGSVVYAAGKEQKSGRTAVDMGSEVVYTVVSKDGASASYTVSALEVDLPVLYVSTPGHAEVKDKVNWHYESKCVILDRDWQYTDYGSTAIKGRGNSSWNFKKKPYALKFAVRPQNQEPPIETVLGMPGHKRWVLLSNYMCYNFGNQIGYEVGRRTTFEWSPRARYVELVLNGVHKGMYSLVEQIRVDKYRVNIKEIDEKDVTPEKMTGGYLMSFDNTMDETYCFKSSYYKMPIMIKSPDDDVMTSAHFQYIQDYINNFEASLNDDKRFAKREYLEYIDIDSFISAWFAKELAGRKNNSSGVASDFLTPRSVYYYKDRGGKLKAGPVWDMDVHFLKHEDKLYCMNCQYYGRLFQDPAFVQRVKELWPSFKANLLGTGKYKRSITSYVDSLYNSCAFAAERDENMWRSIWTSFTFLKTSEQRDKVKAQLTSRIDYMDRQISAMSTGM